LRRRQVEAFSDCSQRGELGAPLEFFEVSSSELVGIIIDKLRARLTKPNRVIDTPSLIVSKFRIESGSSFGSRRNVRRDSDIQSFATVEPRSRGRRAASGTSSANALSNETFDSLRKVVAHASFTSAS